MKHLVSFKEKKCMNALWRLLAFFSAKISCTKSTGLLYYRGWCGILVLDVIVCIIAFEISVSQLCFKFVPTMEASNLLHHNLNITDCNFQDSSETPHHLP